MPSNSNSSGVISVKNPSSIASSKASNTGSLKGSSSDNIGVWTVSFTMSMDSTDSWSSGTKLNSIPSLFGGCSIGRVSIMLSIGGFDICSNGSKFSTKVDFVESALLDAASIGKFWFESI